MIQSLPVESINDSQMPQNLIMRGYGNSRLRDVSSEQEHENRPGITVDSDIAPESVDDEYYLQQGDLVELRYLGITRYKSSDYRPLA